MMTLDRNALEFITEQTRKPIVAADDGSGRLFLLGSDGVYEEVKRFVKQHGAVSTVESLADLVNEYARRFGKFTGTDMTVVFTSNGATFSPDDTDGRHGFQYKRVLSQQWLELQQNIAVPMDHKQFVRVLQALSPSVVGFPKVFAAFRRLVISKDAKLASEPTLDEVNGKANAYEVRLSVRGGTAEATLPRTIDLRLPLTRGGHRLHDVTVEIDLDQDDDESLSITMLAPSLPAVMDEAIFAEISDFKEATKDRVDLLTVVNF